MLAFLAILHQVFERFLGFHGEKQEYGALLSGELGEELSISIGHV